MSDTPKISVALVGFGGSGAGIHAPLISTHARLGLDVIVTRDDTRQKHAAQRHPNTRVVEDIDQARGCAVAVVALPPAYRGDAVDVLLNLGMHVVVEKPLAWEAAEAERLVARADGRLTVFHNRRWDSDFLTLRHLQTERTWRGPARLDSRIQWWKPAVGDGWRDQIPGGGILTEVGTHLIDQAIELLGPVESVYAELERRRRGANAEDEVFLALHHENGSVSHLAAGPAGDPHLPRFQLVADHTLITIGSPDVQEAQSRQGMTPRDTNWGVPDASTWTITRGADPAKGIYPERGWWPAFYDGVVRWVEGGEPPVSAKEAMATMRVVDAARLSSQELRVVHTNEGGRR